MEVTNTLVANHIHKTGSNIFKECLGLCYYCYFFYSFQCIQHRALNPDDPSLPDLEPVIARWQIYTAANTFQHLEFNNSWEIIILCWKLVRQCPFNILS